MGNAVRTGLTEAEYLAFERASGGRHELVDGEVFAMAGGTAEHSAVAVGLLGEIRAAVTGRGCRTFEASMRVHVPSTGRYVYPDGSVVCGPLEFRDDGRDTLVNPRVVIEVLSESTEAYDHGDKFAGYRSMPSVAEGVLASQVRPLVEVFSRIEDGSWTLRVFGPGARVRLASIGCDVDVDRVYAGVFEP